jgi:type II secretory pathway pseudopilin PulG
MKQRGFSLFEVLVSAVILFILVYGVMSIVPNAFFSERKLELRDFACRLAQAELQKEKALYPNLLPMGPGPIAREVGPGGCVFAISSNVAGVSGAPAGEVLTVTVAWDFQGQKLSTSSEAFISHLGSQ